MTIPKWLLIALKKQQEGNKMEGEISLFESQCNTAHVLSQALWKQDSSVTEWEVCPIHAVPSNSTEAGTLPGKCFSSP